MLSANAGAGVRTAMQVAATAAKMDRFCFFSSLSLLGDDLDNEIFFGGGLIALINIVGRRRCLSQYFSLIIRIR